MGSSSDVLTEGPAHQGCHRRRKARTCAAVHGRVQARRARKCGVSHVTIGRFETGHELTKPVRLAIRYTFEEAGIEFEGDPGPRSGVARVELEDGTAVTLRRKQPPKSETKKECFIKVIQVSYKEIKKI